MSISKEICFTQSFDGINVQMQVNSNLNTVISLDAVIIGFTNDTIWHEFHTNLPVSPQNTFTFFLGSGTIINSNVASFNLINWELVSEIVIFDHSSNQLYGTFETKSFPYAYHSLNVSYIPATSELNDVANFNPNTSQILKFDGVNFYPSDDLLADTVSFTWQSSSSSYSDTADFVSSNFIDLTDTANSGIDSDTAQFAYDSQNALFSDTAYYSQNSNFAFSAINNWNIFGNSDLSGLNYLGTFTNQSFSFATNNFVRLSFFENYLSNGNFTSESFQINSFKGVLFIANATTNNFLLDSPYLYFNGSKKAFGINSINSPTNLNVIQGLYSFHFGQNVESKGSYSVVMGLNSWSDTTGSTFDATMSIAIGRYCSAAPYGVAIGDSCSAGTMRNVAIGKNVHTESSSSIGIGNNVFSGGSTSWAAGHNVSAKSNFSTAIGTNASSGNFQGSFIFGDASTTDTVFNTSNHQFLTRTSGGVIFYTSFDLTSGVSLSAGGGSWDMLSDRNKKRNIVEVNYDLFYSRYPLLKLYNWQYIGTEEQHLGPMAQDFYNLFNVGEAPKYINSLDADGIVLAGIKSLHIKIEILNPNVNNEQLKNSLETEKNETELMFQKINELYEKLDL